MPFARGCSAFWLGAALLVDAVPVADPGTLFVWPGRWFVELGRGFVELERRGKGVDILRLMAVDRLLSLG